MSESGANVVTVIFPSLKHTELCNLSKSASYNEAISALCEEIEDSENYIVNISILKEELGYCIPIYKSVPSAVQLNELCEGTITSVRNNDTIVVTRSCDMLSMRYHITLLKQLIGNKALVKELSPYMTSKLCYRAFPTYCFPHWDAFTPEEDGNHYYRSVYFSVFESIVLSRRWDCFLERHAVFAGCMPPEEVDDDVQEVLKSLILASSKYRAVCNSVN